MYLTVPKDKINENKNVHRCNQQQENNTTAYYKR